MIARDQPMIGHVRIGALGSSVSQLEKGRGMASTSEILNSGLENNMSFSANDLSNFVPEGTVTSDAGGVMHLSRAMSLDHTVKGVRDEHILSKNEEDVTCGLESPMGIASSTKTKGKSPISFQSPSNRTIMPLLLSLMESSSNVLVQPTMEEIIAFVGYRRRQLE
jgi:hypothetical protein